MHRLLLDVHGAPVPTTFTLMLSPDERGTFLLTCRELPELAAYGENEEEALSEAEKAIWQAWSARPSSPGFPE